MTARTDRVDALLREEISELLAREVHDSRVGFATVTDVETSPDLGHARVWVSVIGSESQWQDTLRALERAMPFVRRRLGERLRLKRIPELAVRADRSGERGTQLLRIIEELEEGKGTGQGQDPPEALPTPGPVPSGAWTPDPARRHRTRRAAGGREDGTPRRRGRHGRRR